MPKPRVLILRAAGTNCDQETAFAWEQAGAVSDTLHLSQLTQSPETLRDYQILTLPGGFSFGDDIAAGQVFARRLSRHLLPLLNDFVSQGGAILGICNGFQILVKAGLLPWQDTSGARACTITDNIPPGFQDRWVHLETESDHCIFLEPGRRYELPIAHGEGRVRFLNEASQQRAINGRLAALRYVAGDGSSGPANPNGSSHDIAGLCDETGRVFGLMPHPERYIAHTQHPAWTSRPATEAGDGLAMFSSAVRAYQ